MHADERSEWTCRKHEYERGDWTNILHGDVRIKWTCRRHDDVKCDWTWRIA